MEHLDDPYAVTIRGKFMHSGSVLQLGDEFWYNVEMIFPKNKLNFEEGIQVGFEQITRQWHNASSIADKLNEVSWYVEEE